jgi:hypothetical protein
MDTFSVKSALVEYSEDLRTLGTTPASDDEYYLRRDILFTIKRLVNDGAVADSIRIEFVLEQICNFAHEAGAAGAVAHGVFCVTMATYLNSCR